jgi:hypothetical protein
MLHLLAGVGALLFGITSLKSADTQKETMQGQLELSNRGMDLQEKMSDASLKQMENLMGGQNGGGASTLNELSRQTSADFG